MNVSILAVAGVALGLLVAGGVRAAAPDITVATKAVSEFEDRFRPVQDTVLDTKGMFRISEIYPKLEALEQLARQIGEDSPQRVRALDLMSLVKQKGSANEDVVRIGEQCLGMKSIAALAAERRILLIHRVAKAASDLHRYALAAQRYQAALDFNALQGGKLLDEEQRLGIMSSEGYVLHEDGRHSEALEINTRTLREAEHLFGRDDERLTTVLRNLAQNQYSLKRLDGAVANLQRALALAQRADQDDVTDECMFQLGVIAFERDHIDDARRWMKQRVNLAIKAGNEDRLMKALGDAKELEERVEKKKKAAE